MVIEMGDAQNRRTGQLGIGTHSEFILNWFAAEREAAELS
jgi:hypothetical protein